ncbi:hypothetical protein GCM10007276_25520 [Agaricicola taiwanensis]|uniref:DUF3572 family protein n=1 Tax=Agaricicola taiwanensis TaxID=591372 RepID=A0A8J2YJN5_9RHOB|nr:DUF3572 domain-containing protein [Agaricicola taiwanensis]GGE47269.1 hypothetical protein GCM10007276_25520 [Agaricicola taiwanensis]
MPNRLTADPEAIAISALSFIASDAERLRIFLDLTGLQPAEIRSAATSPGFLAAILDHIMSDEALLTAFASDSNVSPEIIPAARHALGRS